MAPRGVLWEPKRSRYGTSILGFPYRPLQGEELVVHNSGGIRVEEQNNLHTRNAAVDAVVLEPGPWARDGLKNSAVELEPWVPNNAREVCTK